MRKTLDVVAILFLICVSQRATGTNWYVAPPPLGSDANAGTEEAPFATIQKGIDTASNGDTVVVAQGTYVENIKFNGKNIVLTSSDPLDANVVASTIIDGNWVDSVVIFSGTEDETCVLTGFTISNGRAREEFGRSWGGGISGAVWMAENRTHAAIRNNVITNNEAMRGGGLYGCDGIIQNNTISQNVAGRGAALHTCHGTIENNIITDNTAGGEGAGGLHDCDGTIRGNLISGNSADEGAGGLDGCDGIIENNVIVRNSTAEDGGGLFACSGTVRSNVIAENSAPEDGGGLSYCNGVIVNNTITGNSAGDQGGGLNRCAGTIVNCIVWGNRGGSQLWNCSLPTYSCIEYWTEGGDGNIAACPYFVDPQAEDYHLLGWSPCIDAGDPSSDFSNEPLPNGGRIDIGAYGNTAGATSKSADTDADGLPDGWELQWFASLDGDIAADPDGDHIPNGKECRYGWDPRTAAETLVENLTKGEWSQSIQVALCESADADEIVVHPGTYAENINFLGKNVTLRGADPLDSTAVANTIIDGSQSGPAVRFSGTEASTCVLSGFTIQNGKAEYGGGICGGTENGHTEATIQNNAITGNWAWRGGGLVYCDGIIENNLITGNSAFYEGGGLDYCNGAIRGNEITENSADSGNGGGLASCSGTIESNTIARNSAQAGGGLNYNNGTIRGNTITANSASSDGGGLMSCVGIVEGNTISGNSAGSEGGGVCWSSGTLQDNVIRGNSAQTGGGLGRCGGMIQNNTITANSAEAGGGGLYLCDGQVMDNDISENSAGLEGGGLLRCRGTIRSNLIRGNTAQSGGGLALCERTIHGNIITGNSALSGGGGLSACDGIIRSNVIVGNSAGSGGGLSQCGTILNNTIVGNLSETDGGGLYECSGTIVNCIIWGNIAPWTPQLYGCSEPTYSCIQDWAGDLKKYRNVVRDPEFVHAENGDYRLSPLSACIDSGDNNAVILPDADIRGVHRIMFGGKLFCVDMGAYEYYVNELRLGPEPGEATLTWSSLADKSYSIFYSDDLLTWLPAENAIPSAGSATTSWVDDGYKTGMPPSSVPCRFYRIVENP